mmetsp:Transcript_17729/g.41240  ORF Transcript_17729/g.41240 Transcript_17729/m.41240 type:complete len:485 (+) Transcript_17729:187-1641(+)|eukprot:CAMPEP_0178411718 /NCGR_PEP_ID=MMETSP0689_2-20121128/21638_1 /TAXON_ID=160604 /ORGANISM="Amphidinium massartii, Strain CS-259" /LENGTH=484 /DNA_ID=CAMNT_0020032931 /DNA_START=95 /DNA_END=1549 /DNA_ORIENTATION=-
MRGFQAVIMFSAIAAAPLAAAIGHECSALSEASAPREADALRSLLQMGDALHAERGVPVEGKEGSTARSESEEDQQDAVARSSDEAETATSQGVDADPHNAEEQNLEKWGEAWEKTSILPEPLQLLYQVEATSALAAFGALKREGAAFAMLFVIIALVVVGCMAVAFIYYDKSSNGSGILPGLRNRVESSTAPLMQRGNVQADQQRARRHLSPRILPGLPGTSNRQPSRENDSQAKAGARGRPPALPPHMAPPNKSSRSATPAGSVGPSPRDGSVTRSSLKRDASTGSNGQVRFADGGGARSSSPAGSNLLCRGLVVPPGSECVLAVPALATIGIPPATSGVIPVRDMAGKAIVNLEVCRPDGGQRPICALKPANMSTEPLAYCSMASDSSVVVYNGRHEAFATLQKIGSAYSMTSERMGVRLAFEGSFPHHSVRVTNSQQLVADTAPTTVGFDNGHHYQLRAAAQSDVGLLLCALVSIDVLET